MATFSFSDLDGLGPSTKTPDNSALDDWYDAIRTIPITELPDGDLARACRQRVYIENVIPVAVERLRSRPLAGDYFEGELLISLARIPDQYWRENLPTLQQVKQIAQAAIRDSQLQSTASDIQELLAKWAHL